MVDHFKVWYNFQSITVTKVWEKFPTFEEANLCESAGSFGWLQRKLQGHTESDINVSNLLCPIIDFNSACDSILIR